MDIKVDELLEPFAKADKIVYQLGIVLIGIKLILDGITMVGISSVAKSVAQ